MNKRIKKKVTKRVLIKIKNKEPLSKFEAKFFTKNILPTFIETFTAVRKAAEEVISTVIEIVTERVNELSDEMKEADQEDNEEVQDFPFNEFINVPLNEFIDTAESSDMTSTISLGKNNPNQARESMGLDGIDAEGFDNLYKSTEEHLPSLLAMDQDNNIFIKKETKWQKAKGKVKGWFGK
ncbi:hypothetical protein [Carnobacterium inhibens]|uniref:hypothetical protein n=1 Tax=Carnobacterium inhibens TaxID=147709 RepID=UPI00054D5605|nr:hypothetical protein [Carnobacterium inhibens]